MKSGRWIFDAVAAGRRLTHGSETVSVASRAGAAFGSPCPGPTGVAGPKTAGARAAVEEIPSSETAAPDKAARDRKQATLQGERNPLDIEDLY